MILAALLRILVKLILFFRLFFDHIVFFPYILVFIIDFLLVKAFLQETLFLCLLLIGLLNLFWTTYFLIQLGDKVILVVNSGLFSLPLSVYPIFSSLETPFIHSYVPL